MKPLGENDLKALVSLLEGEEGGQHDTLRRHLIEVGPSAIPFLEERCASAEPQARRRLEDVLREIRFGELRSQFKKLAASNEPSLETGAFLLARFGYPYMDEQRYRRWLDDTAAAARNASAARAVSDGENSDLALGSGGDPRPLLRRLNTRLFDELRFCGNTQRYYDPDNSFLNRVIEARTGIPISLSVLYILLGRRLGLPVAGAGLPGHFMVLVEWERHPFFVDPFHEGRALTAGQCREFLLSLGYPFNERYLVPCSTREILARMMHNLISIYHKSGRPEEARRLTELVDLLSSHAIKDPGRLLPRPPAA